MCCLVAEVALDNVLVLNQVGEDVAIEAVGRASIEGSVCKPRTQVESVGRVEVEICGNDDVELGIETGLGLCVDGTRVGLDFDSRIELLNLWGCCFGALLSCQYGNAAVVSCMGERTFLPTSASLTKNCAPRSSSVTFSWSASVMEPIPANTRFFAISLARALMETRRMLAVRIFSCALTPQSRICRS